MFGAEGGADEQNYLYYWLHWPDKWQLNVDLLAVE